MVLTRIPWKKSLLSPALHHCVHWRLSNGLMFLMNLPFKILWKKMTPSLYNFPNMKPLVRPFFVLSWSQFFWTLILCLATSPTIRNILSAHKSLPELLTSIDKLRGRERDEALQRALGITAPEIDDQLRPPNLSDDILALRELAEAIETAVRGRDQSALGLNWGEWR